MKINKIRDIVLIVTAIVLVGTAVFTQRSVTAGFGDRVVTAADEILYRVMTDDYYGNSTSQAALRVQSVSAEPDTSSPTTEEYAFNKSFIDERAQDPQYTLGFVDAEGDTLNPVHLIVINNFGSNDVTVSFKDTVRPIEIDSTSITIKAGTVHRWPFNARQIVVTPNGSTNIQVLAF